MTIMKKYFLYIFNELKEKKISELQKYETDILIGFILIVNCKCGVEKKS